MVIAHSWPPQKSKCPRVRNAKKTVIEVDGKPHTFPSHAEARYYLDLVRMQKAGIVKEIELQPVFTLQPGHWKCPDCHEIWGSADLKKGCCRICGKKLEKTQAIIYRADFRVAYADGRVEIIDVKGMETEIFKIKQKIFEYRYPDLTLKVVKVKK